MGMIVVNTRIGGPAARGLCICALLTTIASGSANARNDVYVCQITQSYTLDTPMGMAPFKKDGPLHQNPSGAEPRRFTVYLRSGMIAGSDPPRNDEAARRYVLDEGGGGMSYKLLSVWEPLIATQMLYLALFTPEREKPFIVMRDMDIYTGWCVETK